MASGLIQLDIDPANSSVTAICASQTVTAPAYALLNGSLIVSGAFNIGVAYSSGISGVKLRFVSVGVISTVVFTIVGKDHEGQSITETVTGVTTSPVFTTKYYSQVTSIKPDITTTSAFSVGTIGTAGGDIVSKTVPINRLSGQAAAVAVSGYTGTVNFDIQQTFSDISQGAQNATWFNILSGQTANVAGTAALGATAVRAEINTYTDGAEFQFHVSYNPIR